MPWRPCGCGLSDGGTRQRTERLRTKSQINLLDFFPRIIARFTSLERGRSAAHRKQKASWDKVGAGGVADTTLTSVAGLLSLAEAASVC